MQRCLQLAAEGAGRVAPNPMVGAVLVYEDVIIGQGYHRQYGQAHAEVNCINSVSGANRHLIQKSTLYVSLEPCAHFGKTPPCADLLIAQQIPRVVIGCRDRYKEVDGKGIEKLRAAGISVAVPVLEEDAKWINRRFFTFHEKRRPYVVLKWAQSNDHKIANADRSRVFISNEVSNRLVHKWRSEEAAIMVGTNTALYDNPSLTNRYWNGSNPVRIVLDRQLKIPGTHQLLSGEIKTIIFNQQEQEEKGNIIYRKISSADAVIPQLLQQLFEMNIQSVLVEGGAQLLQSFIDEDCWDEARLITNDGLVLGEGIPAPVLRKHSLITTASFVTDRIHYYKHSI
jgi:diaminohydroxyphosphoribosylaminopyrimidine deaminase/5-amino-6-(5-phosphoribosylamino)uracil reductase